MRQLRCVSPFTLSRAVAIAALLLTCPSVIAAEADPGARFRGTGKADPVRIANVRRVDGPIAGQSSVTFDLAWDHSWRAAWEVSAEQTGGSGPLKLESWDAAWVFAKYRKPGDDGWSHATLSTNASDHSTPSGVKMDTGLTDDGKRGVGAFIYRATAGSGANDFKGVTLRWLHQADGVADPKAVEVKVLAVQMVYVPQCAFWAGDGMVAQYVEEITWGTRSRLASQFSAGDTTEPFRIEGEAALTLGGESKKNLNNRDGVGAWYWREDFATREPQPLPAAFPKGYAAFYCMRNEITEGEYVEFLNTVGSGRQETLSWIKEKEGRHPSTVTVAAPGKPGTPAVYKSDMPHVACGYLGWGHCAAYAGWAGLRAMTELEYEKACRGPLRPVPGEYAWGTAGIAGTDYRGKKKDSKSATHDGYVLMNPGQPDERVVWKGDGGPDATRGNAAWDGAVRRLENGRLADDAVTRPLRVGAFATPQSGRVASGASYWGIMELSGNLWERVVPVGDPVARRFAGTHGEWPEPAGSVAYHALSFFRGGAVNNWPTQSADWNDDLMLRTSDRGGMGMHQPRPTSVMSTGFRCVRTATAGRTPVPATSWDGIVEAAKLSEKASAKEVATVAPRGGGKGPAVRIENVTVAPRDAKTATVSFDISWAGSWRSKVNHDAAWVFLKVRADDQGEWQPVRLAADKVLNPTGYGQRDGTPLEYIVPDGDDGSVGMFLRRAAEGEGDVAARGVTVVLDVTANKGITKVQPFGILMVYVPEGPFHLGSGGLTAGGFYKYTDGTQHALPYQVTGPGAIPTGRQAGKLWAGKGGAQPEDGGEIPASFPNGYSAFYCMKYQILPEQYAGFLNALSKEEADRRYAGAERCAPPRVTYSGARPRVALDEKSATARYSFKGGGARGGEGCFGLSWEDGAAFAAWAGLRPMTELELEKAVRGAREPIPEEVGPSYWGIQTFSPNAWDAFKGDPQCERPVTVGNAAGRKFKATHGRGTTALPADWPQADAVGSGVRCTYYTAFQLDLSRARVSDRLLAAVADPQRLFSHKWRGVRTAPKGVGP